jgi:hypothetical protein
MPKLWKILVMGKFNGEAMESSINEKFNAEAMEKL